MYRNTIRHASLYLAMAVVGFAAGALIYSKKTNSPASGNATSPTSLQDWSAGQPRATGTTPGEKIALDDFARAQRSKRSGKGVGHILRTHLKLVADTPAEDLPELLLRYERTMPGDDIDSTGDLLREAIVERLIAEAPDTFLQLALTGRSEFIESDLNSTMSTLLEEQGYAELERKITATGEIPSVTMRVMHAVFGNLINSDPENGWKIAIQDPRANIPSLAQQAKCGESLINDVILGGNPYDVDSDVIGSTFGSLARLSVGVAMEKFALIDGPGDRLAALGGIASSVSSQSPEEAKKFFEGLASDQERLAFLRAQVEAGTAPFENPFQEKREFATLRLDRIFKLGDSDLKRVLLEERLLSWKASEPKKARAWAEDNDQVEVFERLHPSGASLFPSDSSSAFSDLFDPPEIPPKFNLIAPDDETE